MLRCVAAVAMALCCLVLTGCVCAVGGADPFVIGLGTLRVSTDHEPVSEDAPQEFRAMDMETATPLLFIGATKSVSGVIIGPSRIRSTTVRYADEAAVPGEWGKPGRQWGPILRTGGALAGRSRPLVARHYIGSVGAKVVRQGDVASLGLGYQSRMVGSGITDDIGWAYQLMDQDPYVRILTGNNLNEIGDDVP